MTFKALCIDGGGVRGIYPAHILHRIEETCDVRISDCFDMVVGTSTGSIVAGVVATEYPLEKLVQLYEDKAPFIFKGRPSAVFGLYQSKYDAAILKAMIDPILGNRTLAETKIALVIPATDLRNGTVHVFKSPYSPRFVRDRTVRIADAIVSSCTAPSYFDPNVVGVANYVLADGGIWANNPTMVALTEAIGTLKLDKDSVRILSLGTGYKRVTFAHSAERRWGVLTGWRGKRLLDLILNLQAESSTNQAKIILGDNYLRLNYEADDELSTDDPRVLAKMKNWADYTFTHNAERIRAFLQV